MDCRVGLRPPRNDGSRDGLPRRPNGLLAMTVAAMERSDIEEQRPTKQSTYKRIKTT